MDVIEEMAKVQRGIAYLYTAGDDGRGGGCWCECGSDADLMQ